MKRAIYAGLVLFILSGLTACSNYKYYTAAKNKTNLSTYRTFGWVETPKPTNNPKKIYANDIADENIKDAATAALTAKGLTQSSEPDLLVNYTTMTGRGYRTNYYGAGYGGFGWGGWGYGLGWYRPWFYGGWGYGGAWGGYPVREQFREGTVIIDLIDRKTGKMVWRGYGVGEVRNPQKAINDLPKVVTGIIEKLELTPQSKS
ncbi:DUF4136 domain-containing protein [Mucilaginibacter limnophilus]|uniref:DUF4136 domain-containing protein n=1 Tax=Mucilaginibacter limnophilus TaxID=1932778 RepID=A0A3S2UPI3_9SPHI|nr:DUF4136 domain-containing protein [Mucilaginibacter limnophilus]RVU01235.1 DUF4136 domain-containing protein [Mucilaginibacter limnophilus]